MRRNGNPKLIIRIAGSKFNFLYAALMSKYKQIKSLNKATFRRLVGVKKETFAIMMEVLEQADSERRRRGGRKPKLTLEDQLLLCLEYLREYRTFLHIGVSYGVSESQASRIQRWVETALIQDKRFHLPGRKKLLESDLELDVIVIDASEIAIERPKKNSATTTLARRKNTH